MTFSGMMTDTVTVAQPDGSKDEYGQQSSGTKHELRCRYEQDADVSRDADGKITETADVFTTHGATVGGGPDSFEPDSSTFVWPPGADTTEDTEAVKPSRVRKAKPPSGGRDLWEVTL